MKLDDMIKKTLLTGIECNKNGRIIERDYGVVYKGDLEEQWHTSFIDATTFELRHWETPIIVVGLTNGELTEIRRAYISSKSDSDAINLLFSI